MKVRGVGELGLLERIKPYLDPGAGGDDAAVIPDGNGWLVASTDMFVEGVHFDLGWMSPEDAGWRSLALALGDLAAKGAEPEWALVALAVPADWDVERVTGLYEGMQWLTAQFRFAIAGGDMSAIDGPAVIGLTVVGRTAKNPLPRSYTQPGWAVGVTGPLGRSAIALRERAAYRLLPRIDEGRRLNALGLCCGDISDGLVREMEKFAAMSGAGSVIYAAGVPRVPGASVEDALTSGEEAELVCTGPLDVVRKAGLHVVGEMTETGTVKVEGANLERTGYDHFG
jgi:thiamine-monophosphate kinase